MTFSDKKAKLQAIELDFVGLEGITISILREDQLHPLLSGNKYRKLKYNLQEAQKQGFERLLSFGGAHSNHILALAAAGYEADFETIGVIRGDELQDPSLWGPTLRRAASYGMKFYFVSREDYRLKETDTFLATLQSKFSPFYLVPEGGSNNQAVIGCAEILDERTADFDTVAVAVGTGGTLAGLAKAKKRYQDILGFSALNGTFQSEFIQKLVPDAQFTLTDQYAFGGYAKIDLDLIRFINVFYDKTGIPLDPIYTGKMMYGLVDMLKSGFLSENKRILAIHTGGLQGVEAMNLQLKKKHWPQICF